MAHACESGHVRAMITAHRILREETGPLVVRFRTRCFARAAEALEGCVVSARAPAGLDLAKQRIHQFRLN